MSGIDLAKKIGLTLSSGKNLREKIDSEITTGGVEKILREKFQGSRAVFVAWQIQNIIWGEFDGEKLTASEEIAPEFWLECRIFNADAEIHLKRVGQKLRGRYIRDGVGEDNFYVDSFARLWGENFDAANGCINLLDSARKLHMSIPSADTASKWYGLLTRNYIASDAKTGLSGYVDYRFVSVEGADIE